MINNIQEQVDTYEGMGIPALQKMQQQNPKLLVGIALENLEKTVQEDQRAKLMGTGAVGPSVIDKKLMGLGGLGQQQALATARPGLQQRGKQIQAAQMRKAMGMQPGMQPGMQQAPMRMADGGIVGFDNGGKVQPIPMLMQKYGSEKVMEFLNEQKRFRDIEGNVSPQAREQFEMMKANFRSRYADEPEFLKDMDEAQGRAIVDISEEVSMADGGIVALKEGGFPDLSGDGKVTQKDILMGRGVVDKAQGGIVGFRNRGLVRADDINMENLLNALMIAESGGDPDAVSDVGAEGAYQIMPSTAAQPGFGVSPMEGSRFDPEASRSFAREYLQAMIDRYDGDIEAALIAYNAGAGNADKFISAGRDYEVLPLAMQTQPYVNRVMGELEKEDRRRDIQLGGGRTISTTAPESYTERQRRLKREEQRARETASYPRQVKEGTMYEPNIPDALLVAQAQDKLLAPARLQEQLIAAGDARNQYTPEEQAAGGVGYLQSIGRRQEEAANRASNFLKMMANNQSMINAADPATNLAGINTNQKFIPAGGMDSPAQRMDKAFPGLADSAARYAMSKNVPDINTNKVAVPESTRGNNFFTNIRDDLGEIVNYIRGLFNEGGEVRGFQEGDLVELESGEQVIPLSSVSDDPNILEKTIQLIQDNPYEAASLGLMFIPGVGPGYVAGRAALSAGIAGTRAAAPLISSFLRGKSVMQPAAGRLGRLGQKLFTKERTSGPYSTVRGSVGGTRPGPYKTKQMSPEEAKKLGIPLKREFSPLRTAQSAIGLNVGAAGLGSLLGDDEAVAQPPKELTDMERMQRDVPAVYDAFKKAAEGNKENKNKQEDKKGILSRLGSALSSDRANALYDAFQTLGMAGGAARGQEGTQLIANQMARDFQQQELDAMRERIDVDRDAFATQERLAQFDLIQALVGSPTFDTLAQQVAEEMQEDAQSVEVLNETLKRLLGAINQSSPGLAIGGGGGTGGGGLLVEEAADYFRPQE